MMKLAFACLLVVALCSSKPTADNDPNTHLDPAINNKLPAANPDQSAQASNKTTPADATQPSFEKGEKGKPDETKPVVPPQDNGSKKEGDKSPANSEGANSTKPEEKGKNNETVVTSTEKTLSTEPATKKTVPPAHDVPTSTTSKIVTSSTAKTASTTAPTSSEIKPLTARGFDGTSFVGGIILTLGILAIGFMGFKYYKNQAERNYHTL